MSLVVEAAKGPANWIQDMVHLPDLTQESILENLKLGYAADEIYTYVGPVLVSINPYKRLASVFGEGMIETYAANTNRNALKPHVYCIAQMAFNGLVRGHKNQSVLVSGESGAGKTEVSKFILSFITKQSTKDESGESLVEKQILEANPILEAFGNAKTMRNNNSSRFGKFTKIYFKDATIVGSAIEQYLLEKSRVVMQTEGDRNYHIFFFMFRGLSQEKRTELGLTDPMDFNYLNQSTAHEVKGIDDAKEWEIVQNSFDTFKFSEDDKANISRVLAAILHIGNITFQFNDQIKRQEPADKEVIKRVAELLGLAHPQILEIVLTTRKVSGGGRGSTYSISNTAEEVIDFRDALAKDIYARLFVWLTRKINIKLVGFDPQRPSPEHKAKIDKLGFIGVLDIFGFEVFAHNSFEQLCINFANEKLHQQFLEFMFKVEQEEYAKEGIEWSSIDFDDNGPCLELIEAPMGVLSLLDEACTMPKSTDQTFLEKLESNHARHKFFGQQKRGKKAVADQGPGFEVKHFAYPVYYEVEGFLYKNRDRLYPDLEGALQRSKNKMIKAMYPSEAAEEKRGGGGKKKKQSSLGGTFKKQLQSLYDTIFATEPHYIRCIKPNPKQMPDTYDDEYIGKQLSYVGVMETIRVRKAGFSLRIKFDDFSRRFGYLGPDGVTDPKAVTEGVLKRPEVDANEWKIGKTKAFMKDNTASVLDQLMQQALKGIAVQIQSCVRGMLGRRNLLLKQADLHKQKLEELRERQRPLAFLLQSATRALFVRKAYNAMQAQYHKYMEEERKRKEEEERKRKEEEERKRKEEEERKRREEEERKKAEEERKRREEEEKAKLAAMAADERQKAEEELKKQEEERQKAEAEKKAKAEAEEKAKEAEEKKKRAAEEKARREADAKAREALQLNVPSAPTAAELQAVKVEEMPEVKKDEFEEEEEEEEEEVGRLAMALFDYDGKFLKDGAALMLKKWQIVEIIDELSNDWWLGSAQGSEGLFPAAYVEELGETLKTVVAEYDFESSTDGHLNFYEGTTILVVEERDGWMWGHYDGTYGRFPANYCYDVSQLQAPSTAFAAAESQTQTTIAAGADDEDVYAKVPVFHDALPANAPDPPDFLRAFVQRKLLRAVTPLDHRVSVIRGRDLTASPMVDIAMYLFDDILFFARYHPEDLVFDAVFYVSLNEARLIDLAVDPERKMEGFQVEVKGRSLYTFIFDLPSQKRDWREDTKLVTRKFQAAAMMKLEQELTKQNGKKPGADTLKRKSSLFGKMREKMTGKKGEKSAKSVDVVGLLNPCQLFVSELPEVWRSMFSQIGVSDELSRDNTTAHLDAFTLVHVAAIQERGSVSEAKSELEKSLGNTMDTMRKKTLRAQGGAGLPGS